MTVSSSPMYLIVGAGGAHGATGNRAARALLEMGLPVRAFVHHDDDRSAALKALGAQVVVGDIGDFNTARAAAEGVQRAYFTYPLDASLLTATTTFAAAARRAGVESIVNMSQVTARADHASPAARGHWLAERVLDWSGIGVTHIRPPYFLENLLTIANPAAIRDEGKIKLPYGRGKHAPIAGEDVARVAVGVLLNPSPHHGKTYVATGPESLSMAEQADTFSRVLDRPVRYVDIRSRSGRRLWHRAGSRRCWSSTSARSPKPTSTASRTSSPTSSKPWAAHHPSPSRPSSGRTALPSSLPFPRAPKAHDLDDQLAESAS